MEQIVADPVPQMLDVVQRVPRERVQNLVGKQIVDVPVPQILEKIVGLAAGEVVCNARTGVRWTCPQPSPSLCARVCR